MRNWRSDFKESNPKSDSWYDLINDYPLIEASFLEQYGIRLSEVDMSWREFSDLLSCLSAETPLGRIVAIRSEEDAETLKKFTKEQKKIRDDWRRENKKEMTEEEYRESSRRMMQMLLA